MIQAATSINCSPIKPSFKSNESRTELMQDTTALINDISNSGGIKNVDENTMERLRGLVEKIEVDSDSKVMKPLKTFLLTCITLATGTILTRGTAGRVFYAVKDKNFAQKMFSKLGGKLDISTEELKKLAASTENAGKIKKYSVKGLNYVMEKINGFAEKGLAKDAPEFVKAKGEKLIKTVTNAVGSAIGLTTTGAALSVDKDGNGRSDMLEINGKKKEQEAIKDLVIAVADAAL